MLKLLPTSSDLSQIAKIPGSERFLKGISNEVFFVSEIVLECGQKQRGIEAKLG